MTGFGAFFSKELTEIRRTWRIWVIPGMLVFFGVTSPIIAALTPALVKSMSRSQPGVVIQIPPPTAFDGYAQFIKNLDQFVLIAVIITAAGVISGERTTGTAILALTKPLSRRAFVIAKMVSQTVLLVAATVLGTAACLAMTAVVFGGGDPARLVMTVGLWLVYASLLIVVMTLFSAALGARGAAAGAGLGFYFFTILLSMWRPTAQYTFVGLMRVMADTLMGRPVSVGWPVGTAIVAILVGVVMAVKVFERKEL